MHTNRHNRTFRSYKWLIALPFASLIAYSSGDNSSTVQSIEDVLSIKLRVDGDYDVHCKSGAREIVTLAQLQTENVCTVTPVSPLSIQSMRLRSDGSYDVVCVDQTAKVATTAELQAIAICGSQPIKRVPLALGGAHSCALTDAGGVKCWGRGVYGELGNGSTANQSTPVEVSGLSSGIVALAAGYDHTCALASNGRVKCWGSNAYGQLGNGSTTNAPIPGDVIGLDLGVIAIAAGQDYSCALTSGGVVKCWGRAEFGVLGNGSSNDQLTPRDVIGLSPGVVAIAASYGHTCALDATGAVKCWGSGFNGELGVGSKLLGSLFPVDVIGAGVNSIVAGGNHTCAILSNGGTKCWGSNYFGQLNIGEVYTKRYIPTKSHLLETVVALAAGYGHTCAITTIGKAKCWGHGEEGQLGNGERESVPNDVDVSGLNGVVSIAAGYSHTCALTSNAGIKCWGSGDWGQLGYGPLQFPHNRSIPTQVAGF